MSNRVTPNTLSFFPLFDSNIQRLSEQVFVSSPYPTIQLESVNLSSIIGDSKNATLSLKATAKSAFASSLENNEEFTPWFRDGEFTQNLRLRVIGCFGSDQAINLDFLSQRMNEYQAGLMEISGPRFATSFIGQAARLLGTENSTLLSSIGPLVGQEITQDIRGTEEKLVFYAPGTNDPMSSIVVYDVPLDSAIKKDANGTAVSKKTKIVVAKNGNLPGATEYPDYLVRDVSLNPIHIEFGEDSEYQSLEFENIRFYAFVYLDSEVVNQRLQVISSNGITPVPPTLQTGMGFIAKSIFKGNSNSFTAQEKTRSITGPSLASQIPDPNSEHLIDARGYADFKLVNIKEQMSMNFNRMVKNLTMDANTPDLIKNNNYFSNFWVTKCENDNARYGFVFDKLSFLMENSQLRGLYSSPFIVNDLFNGGGPLQITPEETVKVLNIVMTKRQVKEHRIVGDNELTHARTDYESSYYRPEEVLITPQIVQGMGYLSNDQPNRIHFFEGYDTYEDELKTLTQGTFQYGTTISVFDSSLVYLIKMSKTLTDLHKTTQDIRDLIINSQPMINNLPQGDLITNGLGLYDSFLDEILVPLTKIAFNNSTVEETLLNSIDLFVSLYGRLVPSSVNILDPALRSTIKSKRISGIEEFSDLIMSFKQSIDQVLSKRLPKDPYGEGTTLESKMGQSNTDGKTLILEAKKYFKDLFEFGQDYGTGYLYMSREVAGNIDNPNGLPTFSVDFYQSRVIEEFSKYFSGYSEGNNVANGASPIGTQYAASSYQYLSPKAIKTFGKDMLVQTDFKAEGQNVIEYDLDRYADLFSSLIDRKKISVEKRLPFFSMNGKDLTPRQTFKNLNNTLMLHGCQVKEGISYPFSVPTPMNAMQQVIKVGQEGHDKDEKKGLGIVDSILGGGQDLEASTKDFLKTTSQELLPFSTGTYGAVVDPAFKDPGVDIDIAEALPPTKLIFGIIGEMELNPKTDDLPYQDELFNSMVNDVNKLKIDQQSIKSAVDNVYSQIPNQFKAMFVMAASQNRQSLGTGFDAIRVSLQDNDTAPFAQAISYVSSDEDFPPYKATRDPMKMYSKFLAFWMNYKQIGVIEYLTGFENLDVSSFADIGLDPTQADAYYSSKPLLPVWNKVTPDLVANARGRNLLCRVRSLSKEDIFIRRDEGQPQSGGADVAYKGLFDLPIYNRYFMLRG